MKVPEVMCDVRKHLFANFSYANDSSLALREIEI
jgi:hypothetical protein